MIFDKKAALIERLRTKNLNQQFRNRIEHGMGCSPFISEAICTAVKDVYLPILNSPSNLQPGQMLFTCLSTSNGPSVAIKDAVMITALLSPLMAGLRMSKSEQKMVLNTSVDIASFVFAPKHIAKMVY